jgi:hypothetical protein
MNLIENLLVSIFVGIYILSISWLINAVSRIRQEASNEPDSPFAYLAKHRLIQYNSQIIQTPTAA